MTLVPEIVDMEMPVEGVFHNLVIAKIQKDYAGQGQKVMNAMWGAGQMMFNKILVMAASSIPSNGEGSGNFSLRDYEKVANDIFKSMNPSTDIYFSQGPMDVLDHSCSKMGFGGKMCIDGTFKFEEEKDDLFSYMPPRYEANSSEELKDIFPDIKSINSSLIKKEIPCLIISVEKNRKNHVREFHE
jgi:4-hydroxy-3-polyprenylbenzoate decarboxylase